MKGFIWWKPTKFYAKHFKFVFALSRHWEQSEESVLKGMFYVQCRLSPFDRHVEHTVKIGDVFVKND